MLGGDWKPLSTHTLSACWSDYGCSDFNLNIMCLRSRHGGCSSQRINLVIVKLRRACKCAAFALCGQPVRSVSPPPAQRSSLRCRDPDNSRGMSECGKRMNASACVHVKGHLTMWNGKMTFKDFHLCRSPCITNTWSLLLPVWPSVFTSFFFIPYRQSDSFLKRLIILFCNKVFHGKSYSCKFETWTVNHQRFRNKYMYFIEKFTSKVSVKTVTHTLCGQKEMNTGIPRMGYVGKSCF